MTAITWTADQSPPTADRGEYTADGGSTALVGNINPVTGGTGNVASPTGITWMTYTAVETGQVIALNAYVRGFTGTKLYLALYDANLNFLAGGNAVLVTGLVTVPITRTPITSGTNYTIAFQSDGNVTLVDDGGVNKTKFLQPNTVGNFPATLPSPGSTGTQGIPTLYASGYPPGTLFPQTVASSYGTIGAQLIPPLAAQTITSAEGVPTETQTIPLTAQTISTGEGHLVQSIQITGQTIASNEGTISVTQGNNVTLGLTQTFATFTPGVLADNVSYSLDNTIQGINLIGQTGSFTEGTIVATPTYALTAQTVTSVEGVPTLVPTYNIVGQTLVSLEGTIAAQAGSNFNAQLLGQTIASSQGLPVFSASYAVTAQTLTSVEGIVTFSNVPNQFLLGGQTATFVEGIITRSQTLGTGPPLFIPPQLGKPVTTRTFSWLEMASRAWGSEFRAPDHRIYQFSGGNYKDSTDLGTTGIYSPNLGTPDNPPPHQ